MTSTYDIIDTAPINQVPVEILSEIFSHGIPIDSPIVIGNKTSTTQDITILNPFTIADVCKDWRTAIESISSIWSRVILDLDNVLLEDSSTVHRILENVQRCVKLTKKSENRQFSFSIRGTTPDDAKVITKAVVHVLTSISSRLASLKMDCFRTDIFDLEYTEWKITNEMDPQVNQLLSSNSFPVLKELELLWGCDNPATHLSFEFEMIWLYAPFTALFQNTPLLQNLILDSLRPLNQLNWTHITKLKIVNIYSSNAYLHYVELFPLMTELQDLELSFHQCSPEYFPFNIDTNVNANTITGDTSDRPTFKNLRNLKITTFLNKKLEQGCQYSGMYDIDMFYIFENMPKSKNLESVYVSMHYIHCVPLEHYERVLEGPVLAYIFQSGLSGVLAQRRTGWSERLRHVVEVKWLLGQ